MHISLIVLQSIDGYLARSHDDDLSWGSKEDKQFFISKTKEIGTMIMGSTTFNAMKNIQNGLPFKGRFSLVFTSKPEEYADYKNEYGQVEFFKGTPEEAVIYLESKGKNQAALIGGGKLIQQFITSNLVDELFITVAPVLFGQGVKMCDGEVIQKNFILANTTNLTASEILLQYKRR
jgi:dihydrofolate reductase